MKRAVFEIKQSPTEYYYFTFRSDDQKVRVISGNFQDRAELEKCLSKVRSAAPLAETYTCMNPEGKPPFFWMRAQENGVVFSLIGFKGEIIFSSISYPNELACLEAIKTLKQLSQKAVIQDLTIE